MSKRRTVRADGCIPFGALVLVRNMSAKVADASVANARALPGPSWSRDRYIKNGETCAVEMIEGLGARDLHAIANGPIMDPSELYLPAGKLSMAETRAREAANLRALAQGEG